MTAPLTADLFNKSFSLTACRYANEQNRGMCGGFVILKSLSQKVGEPGSTFASSFSRVHVSLRNAWVGARSREILDNRNRLTSNQGIKRSARHSLSFGLLFGLSFGFLFGSLSGLLFGGWACIQHAVLRYFLWRTGAIPWNYVQFLDYATERILLLRKVGSGYIFIHRLLLDYFVSLATKPDPTLNKDSI